jgi:hypothetical protein
MEQYAAPADYSQNFMRPQNISEAETRATKHFNEEFRTAIKKDVIDKPGTASKKSSSDSSHKPKLDMNKVFQTVLDRNRRFGTPRPAPGQSYASYAAQRAQPGFKTPAVPARATTAPPAAVARTIPPRTGAAVAARPIATAQPAARPAGAAIANRVVKCYNCGGGHYVRDCPTVKSMPKGPRAAYLISIGMAESGDLDDYSAEEIVPDNYVIENDDGDEAEVCEETEAAIAECYEIAAAHARGDDTSGLICGGDYYDEENW